jgi:hypothetical protein
VNVIGLHCLSLAHGLSNALIFSYQQSCAIERGMDTARQRLIHVAFVKKV